MCFNLLIVLHTHTHRQIFTYQDTIRVCVCVFLMMFKIEDDNDTGDALQLNVVDNLRYTRVDIRTEILVRPLHT